MFFHRPGISPTYFGWHLGSQDGSITLEMSFIIMEKSKRHHPRCWHVEWCLRFFSSQRGPTVQRYVVFLRKTGLFFGLFEAWIFWISQKVWPFRNFKRSNVLPQENVRRWQVAFHGFTYRKTGMVGGLKPPKNLETSEVRACQDLPSMSCGLGCKFSPSQDDAS